MSTKQRAETSSAWTVMELVSMNWAEDRGLALPTDVTAGQVALAWNAMEVGLGLERLTQPRAVDGVLARRMGWLLLDAVLPAAQPSVGNDGQPQDRKTR